MFTTYLLDYVGLTRKKHCSWYVHTKCRKTNNPLYFCQKCDFRYVCLECSETVAKDGLEDLTQTCFCLDCYGTIQFERRAKEHVAEEKLAAAQLTVATPSTQSKSTDKQQQRGRKRAASTTETLPVTQNLPQLKAATIARFPLFFDLFSLLLIPTFRPAAAGSLGSYLSLEKTGTQTPSSQVPKSPPTPTTTKYMN